MFTVVIPTLEEEGYIRRTLEHLRAIDSAWQVPIEIVIVDGGSADGTVRQAKGLADRVIVDSPLASKSIAHARNVGAAASSAQFIFHTDADVIACDLPQLLARAAAELADPRVVAMTVPVMPYPWDSRLRDRVIHRFANAFFRLSFRCGLYFARGECQIVRRSAFEKVGGYNGDLISGEDCDLFQRMRRVGKIVYVRGLSVYHSTRRFRRLGYLRILGIYVREAAWRAWFGRSFVREWVVVR